MHIGFARVDTRFEQVRADLVQMGADLSTRIEQRFSDLLKWSFVFWIGAVAAIATLGGLLR